VISLAKYRKEALEHLDSPEQLDTMMQVTAPRRWVALLGLCLLLLVSLGWAILGRVPILVSGRGVITSPDGVRSVYATGQGQLHTFPLKAGDTVEAGQIVATITPLEAGPPTEVHSPGSGQVAEILADVWQPVDPTVPLFKLRGDDSSLAVMLFLTPAESISVQPGMKVQVFPQIAGVSEYGHLLGEVEEVARQPWSSDGLGHLLNNPTEVSYAVQNDLLLPIKVQLQKGPDGFQWSGTKAANRGTLYSGLSCTAKIVVAEKAPISLILGSH
jgi:HlyD family secretion protein